MYEPREISLQRSEIILIFFHESNTWQREPNNDLGLGKDCPLSCSSLPPQDNISQQSVLNVQHNLLPPSAIPVTRNTIAPSPLCSECHWRASLLLHIIDTRNLNVPQAEPNIQKWQTVMEAINLYCQHMLVVHTVPTPSAGNTVSCLSLPHTAELKKPEKQVVNLVAGLFSCSWCLSRMLTVALQAFWTAQATFKFNSETDPTAMIKQCAPWWIRSPVRS